MIIKIIYKQLILIITLTFLFVSVKLSIAQDYFVATTGDDSASGSESFPFRTITYANSVASPGDVVYIRGGEYGEVAINSVPTSRGGYIKFDKYKDELTLSTKVVPATTLNLAGIIGAAMYANSRLPN